jgi:heavy metal efflux system protein
MLHHIIAFSIRQKLIIGLFMIGWIAWGLFELSRLPIDAVPDITNNQVQIITVSPGLSAPDMERLVTFPVEQSCSNISGLVELRSFSRFGLSVITVVFNDETDVYWARQQIAERIQIVQAELPSGLPTPYMAPVTTGLGEIYQYVVRPAPGYEHVYTPQELRTIQDWQVRRALLRTEGVADVSSFGGLLKQYVVSVSPDKLKSYSLSIDDVFLALEQNNGNTGGAYIEKGPSVLFIRSEGLVKSLDDIRRIPLRIAENGTPLLLETVAEVHTDNALRYGAMCFNDQGEVAGAVVMMLKGENSSDVIARVKQRISEIQKQLPEGVIIEAFLDRTKMVNHAIGTVEENLAMAGLIVVFVLVFFFGSMRAGLLVASVIPLSMLFAVILMNKLGVSGNLMSLGAIDFGLIVDGAVIIVEAILHAIAVNPRWKGQKLLTHAQMDEEVERSAGKMMNSAVFGQLIIFVVYLPILYLQGIEGKMFRPMAQTVAFAIAGAFILSLTYIPMMSALVLSKKISHTPTLSDRFMGFLQKHYRKLLDKVLNWKKSIIVSSLLIFGISIVILMQLGGEFIPELEEGDFAVETRVLTGSNLNTTIAATQQASTLLLQQFPEIEKIVTKIGSGEIPTDPMPIEAADMMIILKDKSEWTSASGFDELAEKMGDAVSVIPGITTGFQYPVQMRFNELMTGARQDVVCKIFGENLDTLSAFADKLAGIAGGVEGAVELYVEKVNGMPQLIVLPNREQLARYGVSIAELNRAINMSFAGAFAGKVYEDEKRFDLVVRLAGGARSSVSDIANLAIATNGGQKVPLYMLAEIKEISGPNQIQRENAHRRIVVGFNVRGRDVETIVHELEQKVGEQLNLPAGYTITYGGAFQNLQDAKQRLSVSIPIALLLILLLLYFTFRNMALTILVFTAIPMSAIGGILSLWLRDMPFSISAGVGFIALFGIAVLDSIVLIAKFTELRQNGDMSINDIVREGTHVRLRPVMIAAIVPALGFLPMALSTGAGAEVQRPLATVVIGGLVSSTLLTLVLLPILYTLIYSKIKIKKPIAAASIALLLLAGGQSRSQSLTLQTCLQSGEEHYPLLMAAREKAKAAEALSGSGWNIPFTDIGFEHGNINSFQTDNKVSIDQALQWPGVYSARKKMLQSGAEGAGMEAAFTRKIMRTHIEYWYRYCVYLMEQEVWIQRMDSLYQMEQKLLDERLRQGVASRDESAWATLGRQQLAQWQWENQKNDLGSYLPAAGADRCSR